MTRYRVLLPLMVNVRSGSFGQGEEFDDDFPEADERYVVDSGLLAIVSTEVHL